MAVFPDVAYANPLEITLGYKTLKSSFDDLGKEIRRRKWLYPKRRIVLLFNFITRDSARLILDFYNSMYGGYSAFLFFVEYIDTYVKEYYATGDDSTTTFTLPSKNIVILTLYHDNIAYSDTDYTINADSGEEGADQVVFNAAPADGVRLTVSFTGYLVIRCRFDKDQLINTQIFNRLNSIKIILQGLLFDE